MTIYLLIPRSNMFPTMGQDFIKGLSFAFEQNNNEKPTFIIESIGNGTDEAIIQQVEKKLLEDAFDLALGFCGKELVNGLVQLFDAYQKPFIHTDLGANYCEYYNTSDHVVHLNLNLWQSCYNAGKFAVEKHGKRIALASSFYDGGYQLIHGFLNGILAAGGEIVYNYVSQFEYTNEEFTAFYDTLDQVKPDAVMFAFSYKEGAAILNHEKAKETNSKFPFYTNAIQVDKQTIGHSNCNLSNLFSVASWDETSENILQLKSMFETTTKKEFNIVTLLAFKAGELISNAITLDRNTSIVSQLQGKKIPLVTGNISLNDSHELISERVTLRQLISNNDSHEQKKIISFSNEAKNPYSQEELDIITGSGWKNPYICT